ncbi:hypothetical protein SLA2020_280130 [Shorea laevis]
MLLREVKVFAIIDPVTWLSIPKQEVRHFQLFAALSMDHIWFTRNKLLHGSTIFSPEASLIQLKSTMKNHVSAWNDVVLSSLWIPPKPGSFKANFDVAVRESFSVAAAVICDSSGEIIWLPP